MKRPLRALGKWIRGHKWATFVWCVLFPVSVAGVMFGLHLNWLAAVILVYMCMLLFGFMGD